MKNIKEIFNSLIGLSTPIILANLFQTAYQLIDTFWVGRLGTNAIAAVTLSFPILFFIMSLGGGISIAGSILVAQYKGKKDPKMINHISTQTIIIVLIISLILSIIGYIFSPQLIKIIGGGPGVFSNAVSYLQISFAGMIFLFIYFSFQSLMRGVSEVKLPVYIVLCTVFLDLILDPLFIYGYSIIPPFGVTGAAIATLITEGLSAILGLYFLFSGKYGIRLESRLGIDKTLAKNMLKLGIPASIEQSARALGIVAMTIIVSSFGATAIAAFGIGGRILSFIIIPAMGLSMATSTLVGQNIGAGKRKSAENIAKISSIFGFMILTLIGILFFIFANQIAELFIPGQIKTINEAGIFIKLISISFGFMGIQIILNGVFRGSGNTKISMMLSIISLWVLRFPIAYILSLFFGTLGIWVAFPIANILICIISTGYFLKGKWKHKNITAEQTIKKQIEEETIIEEIID